MLVRLFLPTLLALALLPSHPALAQTAGNAKRAPADVRLTVPLERATRLASLIVHVRAERAGGRTLYRVLETLHGVLEPAKFQGKAAEGFLDLYRTDEDRAEKILFFVGTDKLRTYNWYLPVQNGTVAYQDTPMALAEFKKALLTARPTSAVPLEELVPRCAFIVHCRTELAEGRIYHRVLEVLKGSLEKVTFARPAPRGYLHLGANREGVEMVLCFYGKERLDKYDALFPVNDAKVFYRNQRVPLELFLNQVRKLAGPAEGRSAANPVLFPSR